VKSLKSRIVLCLIGAVALALPPAVFSCPTSLRTDRLGDGQMYNCYLAGSNDSYCFYDCYPQGGGVQ
jgi:hypothetical protein